MAAPAIAGSAVRPASPAIRHIKAQPSGGVRLFCFPYAGSGPAVFQNWAPSLPPYAGLAGLVYPGRESRVAEAPLCNLERIARSLVTEILPLLDRPYAFFGHSMGAYVAFEVARQLDVYGSRPEHLFVSGAGAPHLPHPKELHALPPAEFLRELIRLNGFPPEILREAELIRYALPILRADFTACETYRLEAAEPARYPITAFGGRSDPRVEPARVQSWSQMAGESFSCQLFDGDHFFLREQRPALLRTINQRLAELA